MSKDGKEPRAKALLDQLEARQTTAERLFQRIGHRGFSRPNVAASRRIFDKYRLKDPWDPDPSATDDPIELGPVALKLGDRATVARHLAPPPAPKSKKKQAAEVDPIARFRPKPGDEVRRPKPQPAAQPAPPRPTPAPQAPPSELASEFGRRDTKQPLRKPIPMRPDMAPPDAAGDAPQARPDAVAPVPRSVPRPAPPPSAQGRGSQGRFRMKPTEVSAPVVKEVRALDQVTPGEAAAPSPPVEEKPAPRPQMPPMSDGLDDLFGMAAMGGRMSLGRRKKEDGGGD